jgi:hypothetical protein
MGADMNIERVCCYDSAFRLTRVLEARYNRLRSQFDPLKATSHTQLRYRSVCVLMVAMFRVRSSL